MVRNRSEMIRMLKKWSGDYQKLIGNRSEMHRKFIENGSARVFLYICTSATVHICKFACGHLTTYAYASQCMHVCMYACMCVCCMHQHVVQQVGSAKVASGCLGMNSRMFPQRTPRLLLRMTPRAASETTCRMLPQTTLQTFLRMNPGTAPQMTPWMIPWSTPRTTPRRTRWKIPGHLFSRFLG